MAQLVVQIDGQPPVVHELTDAAVTIGRETDNVLVIADPSVSRHHAMVLASDGPRTLRDLDSANGTTVNGNPITEKLLKPGDVIHFGHVQVSFVTKASAAAKTPPAKPAVVPTPPTEPRPREPLPVAATRAPVLEPAASKTPRAPAEKPVLAATVTEKKLPPLPAVQTPPPARDLKKQAPAAAARESPPPVPISPVKTAPPPEVEATAPVAAVPPAFKVVAGQTPTVAKAPSPGPIPLPHAPRTEPPPRPSVAPSPLPASVPGVAPAPPPVVLPPATIQSPPAIDDKIQTSATPVPPAAIPTKATPPAAEEATPASPGKHWRPEVPLIKKLPPVRKSAKQLPPASVAVSELPPVPDNIGRGLSTLSPALQTLPVPIDPRDGAYELDVAPSFFTRRRLLASGLIVSLLAAGIIGVIFSRHPEARAKGSVTPHRVTVEESKAVATKKLWDQMQQTARVGLQQAQGISFRQYPVMSSGVYDFQIIDDNGLDALVTSLTARARALSQVSREFALLDKTNVDADLVAYANKVGEHWERAAGLDFDAMNLAWAVHERRARPVETPKPALESADVVVGESHAPGATAETMDHVTKLANNWLAERDKFAEVSGKIDLEEKALYRQMAARYKDQFK